MQCCMCFSIYHMSSASQNLATDQQTSCTKPASCHSHPLFILVEYRIQNHQICLIYLEVSVETQGQGMPSYLPAETELLEHVLGSHICSKVIVICHFFVFLLIIKIHSKWVHPGITSFAHCMCQVLVQAPVLTCLDCFFSVSRGNAGYVCVQKESMLSCQCDMDNGNSTFYPPFP